MEIEVPMARSPEFHFNSGAVSPYQSAPSSPSPFGEPFAYDYHYTSAPATPTRAAAIYSHLITASASPTSTPRRRSDVGNFSFTPVRQQGPERPRPPEIRPRQPPSKPTNSSSNRRRKSRSLSPLRDEGFSTKNTCSSPANSTANSVKSCASRRWPWLKDLLLFRSASEGRATGRGSKDPLGKYTILPSVSTSNKKSVGVRAAAASSGGDGIGSARKANGLAVSAHELHYTANRAAAEEQRKKMPLPYRSHGLLGFIQFNPAVRGISKGLSRSSFST